MTKETLLSYKWFIDNEYLEQYLELVNTAELTVGPWLVNAHHVIPVCWYKKYHLYVGNRTDNEKLAEEDTNEELVDLSYADHCKAHWLLTRCTVGSFNCSLTIAYIAMVSMYLPEFSAVELLTEHTDDFYDQIQIKKIEHYKLTKNQKQKVKKARAVSVKTCSKEYTKLKSKIRSIALPIYRAGNISWADSKKLAAKEFVIDDQPEILQEKLLQYINSEYEDTRPVPKGYTKH